MKKTVLLFCCLLLGVSSALNAQWTRWNWEKLTLPPPFDRGYYLDAMFLPNNPNFGWVCGYNGYVLRTTDGGDSWQGTVIPTGAQLESIIFLNERVGYCSGTDQGYPEEKGGIFKSTDGGATWREITPLIRVLGVTRRASLWGCYFINENVGMVVGGGCGGEVQQFFRTTDGGNSWNRFVANATNTGLSHVLMYTENGLCYASSSGMLWESNDGGRTWSIFAQSGPQFWQENLTNKNNSFLVATAGQGCFGGTEPVGDARFTTDRGQSWRAFNTGAAMFGAYLLNETTGWIAGFNRAVFRTSDAGKTWTPFRCGLQPNSNFDDLWFVNDTLGYVVGDGIYRTTNRDLLLPLIVSSNGNFTLCDGQSITLSVAKGDDIRTPYSTYVWSNGAMTPVLVVTQPGEYSVRVFDGDSCRGASAPVKVLSSPSPKPRLLVAGDTAFCDGGEVQLSVDATYRSYLWSNGATTSSIKVKTSGSYKVTVTDSVGCQGTTASVNVKVHPLPQPRISSTNPQKHICFGDSIILTATPGFSDYTWSDGSKSPQIVVKTGGVYTLTVQDVNGCVGKDSITVTGGQKIVPAIAKNAALRFCEGDSLRLSATQVYSSYEWSNGSNSSSITVGTSGKYKLKVTDEYGCVGESEEIEVIVDANPITILSIPHNGTYYIDTTNALRMTCDSFFVKNSGDTPLVLDQNYLFRNIEFSVPQAQFPLRVEPHQSLGFLICYQPTILGTQRDTLIVGNYYCKVYFHLQSTGAANEYDGISRCKIPLELVTSSFSIPGLYVAPPYPNPASEQVLLAFIIPAGTISQISLIDVLGNEVAKGKYHETSRIEKNNQTRVIAEAEFSTAHLAPGMYYARIVTEQETRMLPVNVQR